MNSHSVLERLLRHGGKSNPQFIASRLIKRFGHLSNVLDASLFELGKVTGIDESSAALIKLVKEAAELYLLERLRKRRKTSPKTAIDFSVIKLAGRAHEAFLVLYLNARNDILHEEIISEGTADVVMVYPRRIIEMALTYRATGIILSHNHPSGDLSPSKEDKALTRAIKKAGEFFDIELLDHLIVGPGGHYSFRRHHLL